MAYLLCGECGGAAEQRWTGGSGMVISTVLQTLYQTLVKKVGQGGSIGQVGLKENREGVAEDPGIFTEVLRTSENLSHMTHFGGFPGNWEEGQR